MQVALAMAVAGRAQGRGLTRLTRRLRRLRVYLASATAASVRDTSCDPTGPGCTHCQWQLVCFCQCVYGTASGKCFAESGAN